MTISQLKGDKPALLEFLQAAGQGILTQLPSSTAGATGATPAFTGQGHLALPAVGVSPFAAVAAVAAAAAASTPGARLANTLQVEQQQEQQPYMLAGARCGGTATGPLAAASVELPTTAEGEPGLGLGLGLDGASSYNLDSVAQRHHYFGAGTAAGGGVKEEQAEQGESPYPAAAQGPNRL